MNKLLKYLILLGLILSPFAASTFEWPEYTEPSGVKTHIIQKLYVVTVPPERIREFCYAGMACYHWRFNVIYVSDIEPDNPESLQALGEEVAHYLDLIQH